MVFMSRPANFVLEFNQTTKPMLALITALKCKLKLKQEQRAGGHRVAHDQVLAAAPMAPGALPIELAVTATESHIPPASTGNALASAPPSAGQARNPPASGATSLNEEMRCAADSDTIVIFDGLKDPEKLRRQENLWPEAATTSISVPSQPDSALRLTNAKMGKERGWTAGKAATEEFMTILPSSVEYAPLLLLKTEQELCPKIDVSELEYNIPQEVISIKGLSLSHLHELADKWGSPESLKGKSTADFCAEFIIPMTLESQLSVVNQYLGSPATACLVHDAQWFISHAWMNSFLDLLNALDHFFAEQHIPASEAYIWLDILSSSQIFTHNRAMDWLLDVIRPIKHVIIVLQPWMDPVPLKRSWCILEVYLTRLTDSNFHVALPEAQASEFMDAFRKDPAEFHKVLKNVNCERSETSISQDKDAIFDLIRSKVGFSKLDQMVFGVFEAWISSHLQSKIDKAIDPVEKRDWQASLGRFYRLTGDYDSAAVMLKKASVAAQEQLGLKHTTTLCILADLGEAYMRGGNYADAESMLAKAIVQGTKAYGESHPVVLRNLDTLANIQRRLGKFDMAEMLMQRCLDGRIRVLGHEHPETLDSINNMAIIYQMQARLDEAEVYLLEAIEIGKKILGEEHLQVLEALSNLASLCASQGKFSDAQILLESSLDLLGRKVGESSLATWTKRHKLAIVNFKQGEYSVAKKLHEFNMDIIENNSKECTQDGLNTLSNLAACHLALGQLSVAEEMLLQWMEIYPGILPEKHLQTLLARDRLAQVYIAQNRLKEAESICTKNLEVLRDSHGQSHMQTLDSTATLAELRWKQKRADEARNLLNEVIAGKQKLHGKNHNASTDVLVRLNNLFGS
ncbi:hypothetical protein BC830DRAFT_746861 [Chytriomyces sp. MP71]|nr:hypothetical protein BC830DRAFT_746861 [Chytriomyces sp. MP71]